MTLANVPAMRPRTKHINNKYHHFRSFVANGQVTILAVKSENQCADMLTKPNNVTDLVRHRKRVMGWQKGECCKIRRGNLNGTTINVKNDYASKAHSASGYIDNDRHTHKKRTELKTVASDKMEKHTRRPATKTKV